MSDNLVLGVFTELATLEGKRNADGSWNDTDIGEFTTLLRRSMRLVADTKRKVEDADG
ncbi:hypothetical protein [Marinibacterium sp. SX1]|uniref:hypothetical protein n=1 Tax=Marinibacterium sp. SX1 TaxID=3388424 RepID=UPI003D166D3A